MIAPLMRLLLVRHGETEANRHGAFLGRTDSPLTAGGRDQMQTLAKALVGKPLAAIYTSPLQRAFETAQTIARHHPCPFTVDERLLEQDFGQWEGLTFDEVAGRFPIDFAAWQAEATIKGPTDGETLMQVRERVVALYSDVVNRHQHQTVLLVAHGGVLNALVCALLQTPLRWLWAYQFQPGSLSEVLVFEEGCALTRLNSV